MVRRKGPRYLQLVTTEAGGFAAWPVGRRPPAGWRALPFAGTVQACGRYVAELSSSGAARADGAARTPVTHPDVRSLVEMMVRKEPDAPALSLGDELRLTYRQLWDVVEQRAERLAEWGAGPGRRVAMTAGPAADLLATALAVMVTGATCVLSVPGRANDPIVATTDARPALVLAPAGTVTRLSWWRRPIGRWHGITGASWQACAVPDSTRGGGAPASAGDEREDVSLVVLPAAPRVGAGVVWRGQQLAWLGGDCGLPALGSGDRLEPLSSDLSVSVVAAFRALLTGAELILPADVPDPHDAGLDGAGLHRGGGEMVRWRLRTHRTDGPVDDVQLAGFAGTTMLYASVIPRTDNLKPLPHIRQYVFDPQLTPVSPGEVGELYVAGPAVAAGYLDRPELTMSRFLPDPMGPSAGGLMFRTGALARQLPDRCTLLGPSREAT